MFPIHSPFKSPLSPVPWLAGALCLASLAFGCGSTQRPDGGSGLLLQGNTVSTLTATDQRGATVRVGANTPQISVVYFYPKDGTPGCTKEACAFRDVWKKYQAANIRVIGVSNDDQESHTEFTKAEQLPFSLVADTDGTWARTFGVSSFAGFYARVTFLVGTNGVVLKTYRDVDPGVHALEILQDAHSLVTAPVTSNTETLSNSGNVLAPAPRIREPAAPSVHLTLQATHPTATASGGEEFWLGATLTPPTGSHLYWKHSGEVGLPTRIEFTGPPGAHIGEVRYPGPLRLSTERGQVGYGYNGPVTIVAHVTLDTPPQDAAFQVFGSWLSCDVRCVKEQDRAVLTLRKGLQGEATLELAPLLAQLTKPGSDAGLTVTYDRDTKAVHIRSDQARELEPLELFPEQDLGPEDRVPERQATAEGLASWKWHAAAEPHVLTVLTTQSGHVAYYQVAR